MRELKFPIIIMGTFEPRRWRPLRQWWIRYESKTICFMCHGAKGGFNSAKSAAKQMKAVLKTNPKIYKESEIKEILNERQG